MIIIVFHVYWKDFRITVHWHIFQRTDVLVIFGSFLLLFAHRIVDQSPPFPWPQLKFISPPLIAPGVDQWLTWLWILKSTNMTLDNEWISPWMKFTSEVRWWLIRLNKKKNYEIMVLLGNTEWIKFVNISILSVISILWYIVIVNINIEIYQKQVLRTWYEILTELVSWKKHHNVLITSTVCFQTTCNKINSPQKKFHYNISRLITICMVTFRPLHV